MRNMKAPIDAGLALAGVISETLARIYHTGRQRRKCATWQRVMVTSDRPCAHCGEPIKAWEDAFKPTVKSAVICKLRLHPACVTLLPKSKLPRKS